MLLTVRGSNTNGPWLVILFKAASKNEAHLFVRLETSNIITNLPHITPLKLYVIVVGWGCGWE